MSQCRNLWRRTEQTKPSTQLFHHLKASLPAGRGIECGLSQLDAATSDWVRLFVRRLSLQSYYDAEKELQFVHEAPIVKLIFVQFSY